MRLKSRNEMRGRTRLQFERLDARLVLSASSGLTTDVPAGEGETHFVQQQDELVFVIGTEADNSVELMLGTETHRLIVDGTEYEFDANVVTQFQVAGATGMDEVRVAGTALDDRARIDGTEAELKSSNYKVLIESFDVIRLSGAAGDDRVQVFDSPGDDQLYLHSTFAALRADNQVTTKVSGFERVEAFASTGYDVVNFYDSPANDRFHAKDGFSFMIGETFWNFARGFDRVDAFYRAGGQDEAILRDSPGDDQLVGQPHEVVFLVGDAVHVTHDFPVTRAYASSGNDRAELRGQIGAADTFVGQPNSTFLRTPGVAVNVAVGFDRVEAFAEDPEDRAELKGSSGNDVFVGLPTVAELRGDGFQLEANSFGLVRAFGEGGDDRAYLQDSEGDDRFEAKDGFSFIYDTARTYQNYVAGFVVDVTASGGFDYAFATGYGPADFLILDSNAFLVLAGERSDRVISFDRSAAFGDDSGVKIREPYTLPLALQGVHDFTKPTTPEQEGEIVSRLDEPRDRLFAVIGGDIDFGLLGET